MRLRPRVLSSTKTSCYCGDDASGVDPRASCRVTYLDPASSSGPPQPTVRKSPAKQPRKPQRPEAKGKRRRSCDDPDSDEVNAPVPSAQVTSETGNTAQPPAVLGYQAQDEGSGDSTVQTTLSGYIGVKRRRDVKMDLARNYRGQIRDHRRHHLIDRRFRTLGEHGLQRSLGDEC
ncbi:hypothetical protein PC110_g18037 [Phytophthora cactorum]|uniref:Uncharacterized protein n=1 Tax=Phytophthora cactorum TaxID=29920 RepID=A0A329RLI2_9STRA|nr:hypothetical protein PC110_g18037 [Phytophthora cactorum]